MLCTDGSGLLASVAQALDIEHQPVNASKGQRVGGAWHVQNVNAYQSRLKQVNDAKLACVSGTGGWFCSSGTMILGRD